MEGRAFKVVLAIGVVALAAAAVHSLAAFLAALATLEVALQVAGWASRRRMYAPVAAAPDPAAPVAPMPGTEGPGAARSGAAGPGARILCIGDSWTYGIGAPKGEAYPDHLRRVLGDGWTVVNRGWPGASSSHVAARLPGWLTEFRPAVVIAMAGANNWHNTLGGSYRALVEAGLIRPSRWRRWAAQADRALWKLALWRLVRWSAVDEGRTRFEGHADAGAAYGFFEGRTDGQDPFRNRDHEADHAFHTADEAQGRGDSAAVTAALLRAFDRVRGIEDWSEYCVNHLLWLQARGTEEQFRAVSDLLRTRLPPADYRVAVEDPFVLQRDHEVGAKMLWYDLARIHEAVAAAGATLVVLSYPQGVYKGVMGVFASVHRVPFIDLTLTGLPWRKRLRGPQGRLTGEGNRLLAEHVAARLRGFGLLGGR
jgi:hypothetical protein